MSFLDSLRNLFKADAASEPELEPAQQPDEESENHFAYADASSIAPDERPFYQEDSYYTFYSYPGTMVERRVVSFDERKKTTFPSKRGLYVAEILLLEYCRKGDYPKPKYGYPGFWWFTYGIRDVGHALESLAQRGFLRLASAEESASCLTIPELKKLLKDVSAPVSGKKAELVDRVKNLVPADAILRSVGTRKYHLTDLGEAELEENAYVPYMHRAEDITIDVSPSEPGFNIWRINRELGGKDVSGRKGLVDQIRTSIKEEAEKQQQDYMEDLKRISPKTYERLKEQITQIALIQEQEALYKENKDLDALIKFWEKLWRDGGLKFEGMHWHFRLVDLYIKKKQYDDALALCKKILAEGDPYYIDKANSYIQKIQARQEKQHGKNSNT